MDKERLIIPPTAGNIVYFNNETVRGLWREASQAIQNAAKLPVVGYSLPESDLGMRFLLAHSSPSEQTPVHVVDKDCGVADGP